MNKLRTNEKKLVKFAVQGGPVHAGSPQGWRTQHDGSVHQLPGVGSITYNIQVGDSAFGWAGDHVEPGVSTTGAGSNRRADPNRSYNLFSCVGNRARLISGEAKGEFGTVIGTHGGCEHVMIDFPEHVLERMTLDDKILVRAFGQGLTLDDYPGILVQGLDPHVLHQMPLEEVGGRLRFPVVATVPAELLGSGLGRADGAKADIDIQTSDPAFIKKHGLDKLRMGDFVALMDYKAYWGWSFQQGAVTIGVVIHSDSGSPGHGPGITTMITSLKGRLEPVITPEANLGYYLKIGRYREDD